MIDKEYSMVSYKEFKKLVCLICLEDSFSNFPDDIKLKSVNETITENEDVIKERYEGLFEAFGEKLSLKVCNEHAGDLAYILRLMWQ